MLNKTELVDLLIKVYPDNNIGALGQVFTTTNNEYFYDSGTGKVFNCGSKEFEILSYISNDDIISIKNLDSSYELSIGNILNLISSENILITSVQNKFFIPTKDELNNSAIHGIEQVVLELTEQCNLRCKYCIYHEENPQFRGFSTKNMSEETGMKAIDYMLEHSNNDLIIGFYGGEPLLRYTLMKKLIEYSISKKNTKKLSFSFTTNGVLITEEMAEYLASLDATVLITCSIDGPEHIHDEWRIDGGKAGSFSRSIRGLKYLINAFDKKTDKIAQIYSVLCPPYTKEKYIEISDYFNNASWIPEDIQISYTYVKDYSLDNHVTMTNKVQNLNIDDPMAVTNPIKKYAMEEIMNNNIGIGYGEKIEKANIFTIHNRLLIHTPSDMMPMNGCCVPGKRRVFISTDGDFKVCEKIGDSPSIGNISKGIEIDKLYKYYIADYKEKSLQKCKNCWIKNICPVCYASCYSEFGIDMEKKDKVCHAARLDVKNRLVQYHEILEQAPDKISKIIA